MIPKLNRQGYFSSAQCTYYESLPTSHRHYLEMSNTKCKVERDGTCGIEFYAP